jgi:bile acid-coenzyme A ligase
MTRAFVFVPPKNPQPLGQMLDVQAARAPQRPALTCGATTLSRKELAFRARARAHALRKAGVQEGDLVALALPTGTAVLEFAFGCWMLGATPTPLSHRLPPL